MKLLSLLTCIIALGSAATSRAQNADALVAEGRAFLVAHDLTNANARFASAVSIAPFNDPAKVLYAATRILTLAEKPAGKALLDKLGFTATNRSIYAWTATVPTDTNGIPFAPTNMSASELTGFIRTNVLAEVIGAGANLATVNNRQFTLLLTADETSASKVTLDYGDLLLMRAALKFMQYAIYTVNSWNVNVQLETVREIITSENPVAEDVFQRFPNLATFATTNDLNAAQQAFSQAVSLYSEASSFIRARPTNEVRLFNYDPESRDNELIFRTTINELKQSLNGPVVLTAEPHYPAYFGQFFSGQHPLRGFLPEIKSNAFVVGTLPDPTFGGLVEGFTGPQLEKLLGAEKHLGIPYVLRFAAPVRMADGSVLFSFPGINDSLVGLQASPDLQTWYSLDTYCVSNGSFAFIDPNPALAEVRYFRTVNLSGTLPGDFRPAHDRFAQRGTLNGANATVIGFLQRSSFEPGEPFDSGYGQGSLWWTWTAPVSGRFVVDTTGSHSSFLTLAVYVGNSLEGLSEIDSSFGDFGPSSIKFDAIAGTTYQFTVVGDSNRGGKVVLNLRQVPSNDDYEERFFFGGRTNTLFGSNINATKEDNCDEFDPFCFEREPEHAGNSGGSSVWWTWTAPVTAFVTIDTFGSSFDTLLAVYLDEGDVFFLSPVASNDDYQSDTRSRVTFLALEGTQYAIAVDGYNGASGNIVLNLRQPTPTPPPNDNFANRRAVSGFVINDPGFNVGATKEPGEPNHAGASGHLSVWWTWTAPITGNVNVSIEDSSFDAVLGVYTGNSVTNLSLVASDYGFVQFSTFAGATYQIAVDSADGLFGPFTFHLDEYDDFPFAPQFYGGVDSQDLYRDDVLFLEGLFGGTFPMRFQWFKDGAPIPGATNSIFYIAHVQPADAGTYSLRATNSIGDSASGDAIITFGERPVNDNFTNRIALSGTDISVTGTNLGATFEPGEPDPFDLQEGQQSVWWTWTAPIAGDVTIDTIGSDFGTLLAVFTGDSLSNLSLVAFDGSGAGSQVTFSTDAGATYQIAVLGYFEAGTIGLNLHQVAAPLTAPEILDGPYSISAFPGRPVSFETFVIGSFPLYFQWFRNNQPVPGATGPVLTIPSVQVTNAGTYYLRITNAAGVTVSENAVLVLIVPPGNDSFANRSNIVGTSDTVFANTVRATREIGEPVHAGIFGTRSVWWTWTAPIDGEVTIDTAGSDYETTIAVYLGNSLSHLMVVAADDGSFGAVTFSTAAGATYQIAVDSLFGPGGNVLLNLQELAAPLNAPEIFDGPYPVDAYLGDRVDFAVLVGGSFPMSFQWLKNGLPISGATNSNFTILSAVPSSAGLYSLRASNAGGSVTSDAVALTLILPPPNDLFNNRILIPGQSNTVFANTILASREENEPEHAGYFGNKSVWWKWTAPVNGTVTFSTASDEFPPLLAVYTGNSLASLIEVGSDFGGGAIFGESVVSFSTAAGETYQIAVDGYFGEFGNVSLTVNQVSEPLEAPQIFDGPFDQSVILPDQVEFYASVSGSLPIRLQWFKDGQPIVGATHPELFVNALSTNDLGTYSLQVSNPAGVATASATLSEVTPPLNDAFADRIVIPGQSNTVTANNILATREADEPLHVGVFSYNSVWWTWTAPINGDVTFSTVGNSLTTLLAVYTGNSLSNLTVVGSVSGNGTVTFSSAAGATYQIAVDSLFSAGNIRLSVNQVPAPFRPPQFSVAPFNQTVAVGSFVNFSPSVVGTFPMTFRWSKNGQPIIGATNLSYSIPSAQTNDTGTYSLLASNAVGTAVTQAVLTVRTSINNDFFTNRISIIGRAATLYGTNTLATAEPNEPFHFGSAKKSLWWTWTAPVTGQAQINTIGSNFDTVLAVYTGNAISALSYVVNDDDSGGAGTSRVFFNATAGVTYQIAVDSYSSGGSGTVVLNLQQ